MVNSDELISTTEYLTLYTRCRINRCRYNRVRLYFVSFPESPLGFIVLVKHEAVYEAVCYWYFSVLPIEIRLPGTEEFCNILRCPTHALSSVSLWASFNLHLISISSECPFDSK
jgi:hypothetical protein